MTEHGTAEVGPSQVGTTEVGTTQVGGGEPRAPQIAVVLGAPAVRDPAAVGTRCEPTRACPGPDDWRRCTEGDGVDAQGKHRSSDRRVEGARG